MKKIIKASAGTGKTYSLALEYIKELILGTDFRKIYVMTFTKKATSEIRERVLLFLGEISEETETGNEILENIRKSDPAITVNHEKMKIIYKDIIYNKDKTKILVFKIEDGRDYYMLPGGRIEFNESSIDSIKREIFPVCSIWTFVCISFSLMFILALEKRIF